MKVRLVGIVLIIKILVFNGTVSFGQVHNSDNPNHPVQNTAFTPERSNVFCGEKCTPSGGFCNPKNIQDAIKNCQQNKTPNQKNEFMFYSDNEESHFYNSDENIIYIRYKTPRIIIKSIFTREKPSALSSPIQSIGSNQSFNIVDTDKQWVKIEIINADNSKTYGWIPRRSIEREIPVIKSNQSPVDVFVDPSTTSLAGKG